MTTLPTLVNCYKSKSVFYLNFGYNFRFICSSDIQYTVVYIKHVEDLVKLHLLVVMALRCFSLAWLLFLQLDSASLLQHEFLRQDIREK